MRAAYICVDVQNDFCEGGALAIEGGNEVAETFVNEISRWNGVIEKDLVFTRDWHNAPPDTNGGHFGDPPDFVDSWPVHCVAGTEGAEFHPAIAPLAIDGSRVFSKGQGSPDYSGFQGVNDDGESLFDFLVENRYDTVVVFGLAGDHCVRQTMISAIELGFKVYTVSRWTASVGGKEATDAMVDKACELQGLTRVNLL